MAKYYKLRGSTGEILERNVALPEILVGLHLTSLFNLHNEVQPNPEGLDDVCFVQMMDVSTYEGWQQPDAIIGEVIAGGYVQITYSTKDQDLPPLRQNKKNEITTLYTAKSAGDMAHGPYQIDMSLQGEMSIKAVRDAFADGTLTGTKKVVTKAGDRIDLDTTSAQTLYAAVVAHKAALREAEAVHYDAINALTGAQEIFEYDTSTGWP